MRLPTALAIAMAITGGSLFVSSVVSAAPLPPDFLPPNPSAVSVAEGEDGFFALPGLLMAEPVEIKADCTTESGDPVITPPGIAGQPDSGLTFGIKNSTGPQIATCTVQLIGVQSSVTYTLVLYYGLPLPTTTTGAAVATPLPTTGRDVSCSGAAAAGLLVLGGGLMVITRRKARPEF